MLYPSDAQHLRMLGLPRQIGVELSAYLLNISKVIDLVVMLAEDQIDISLKKLFKIRFRLGMFDPADKNPYAHISENVLESDAHRQQALKMAHQSMVLLKNDGLLPFGRKIRKVAVLGPNAAKLPMGGGSGEGSPFEFVTIAQGLQAEKGFRTTCLIPAATSELASSGLFFTPDGKPGLRGEFYANRDLQGPAVVTTTDSGVDFFWAGAPAEGLPEDHFSARWTGVFRPSKSERAVFTVSGDDGYRLFVDDEEVLEHWSDHGVSTQSAEMDVEAGRTYNLRLEFYDNVRTAEIKLQYAVYSPTEQKRMLAAADAVVYCAGFDKTTESENFDRPFSLPESQLNEIAAAAAYLTGKSAALNSD